MTSPSAGPPTPTAGLSDVDREVLTQFTDGDDVVEASLCAAVLAESARVDQALTGLERALLIIEAITSDNATDPRTLECELVAIANSLRALRGADDTKIARGGGRTEILGCSPADAPAPSGADDTPRGEQVEPSTGRPYEGFVPPGFVESTKMRLDDESRRLVEVVETVAGVLDLHLDGVERGTQHLPSRVASMRAGVTRLRALCDWRPVSADDTPATESGEACQFRMQDGNICGITDGCPFHPAAPVPVDSDTPERCTSTYETTDFGTVRCEREAGHTGRHQADLPAAGSSASIQWPVDSDTAPTPADDEPVRFTIDRLRSAAAAGHDEEQARWLTDLADTLTLYIDNPARSDADSGHPEPETVPCDRCGGSALVPMSTVGSGRRVCRRRGCAAEPGKPAGRLATWERDGVQYVLADEPDRMGTPGEVMLYNGFMPVRQDPKNRCILPDPILVPAPSAVGATADDDDEADETLFVTNDLTHPHLFRWQCTICGAGVGALQLAESARVQAMKHRCSPGGATAEDRDSDELAAALHVYRSDAIEARAERDRAVAALAQAEEDLLDAQQDAEGFQREAARAVAYADRLREGLEEVRDAIAPVVTSEKNNPDEFVIGSVSAYQFVLRKIDAVLAAAAPAPVPSPEEPGETPDADVPEICSECGLRFTEENDACMMLHGFVPEPDDGTPDEGERHRIAGL